MLTVRLAEPQPAFAILLLVH